MVSVFIKMRHATYASSSVADVKVVESDGGSVLPHDEPRGDNWHSALASTDWSEIVGVELTTAADMLALLDKERDDG